MDVVSATLCRLVRGEPRMKITFEDFWALREVDLSKRVEPGEVVGIIGRNGAGKSTLLKILFCGSPSRRRAVPESMAASGSLLEVGTGFHPELTGRENIYLNGTILGMRKVEIDRKFDQIVDFSETEKFLDTPVKRYSSGMYVRLAFAIAAHLGTGNSDRRRSAGRRATRDFSSGAWIACASVRPTVEPCFWSAIR